MKPLYPAEWESHAGCWLAWPSHKNLWGDLLAPVQDEFIALCTAIAGTAFRKGERPLENIYLLVNSAQDRAEAEKRLQGLPVSFFEIPFGDIWLRDTAPIFCRQPDGRLSAASFQFNGWGGKYVLPGDAEVSRSIAKGAGLEPRHWDWVLEGGSLEVDGLGTCITTEQCLLNPNRNKSWTKAEAENCLKEALGFEKILWIKKGLLNDHTDGHIDTLVRFVGESEVVCMEPSGKDDPNASVLLSIREELSSFTDAKGKSLKVHTIPSPGKVLGDEGEILAASYVNFYIANHTVVVPTYGSPFDTQAVEKLQAFFPDRKVLGLSARAILHGGGAFHCITQQMPERWN